MVRTEWNTVEEKDKTAAGIQVVQIQMAGETKWTFTNKISSSVKIWKVLGQKPWVLIWSGKV